MNPENPIQDVPAAGCAATQYSEPCAETPADTRFTTLVHAVAWVVVAIVVAKAAAQFAPERKAPTPPPLSDRNHAVIPQVFYECQYLCVMGEPPQLVHMPQCTNCVARGKMAWTNFHTEVRNVQTGTYPPNTLPAVELLAK